jgi:hypothetical protein
MISGLAFTSFVGTTEKWKPVMATFWVSGPVAGMSKKAVPV